MVNCSFVSHIKISYTGAGSFLTANWLGFGTLTAVAQFPSPVRELRFCKQHSIAKKEKKNGI